VPTIAERSAGRRFDTLALLLLAACNDAHHAPPSEPPHAPPPPPPADASIDAPPALPAGFPQPGAASATGTLAGMRFAIAKGHVRTSSGYATLDLYGWKEGDACEPQFAPADNQLYISVQFRDDRLRSGATIAHNDDATTVTYKKPKLGPSDATAYVVIDALTDTRAKGRILLSAPDDTRVAGSFDVPVCKTVQPHVDARSMLGVAWGDRPELAALPDKPIAGALIGKEGAPVAVEAVDWSDNGFAQHEVHFLFTAPKQRCAPAQISPGFQIGFPATLAAGLTARADVSTVSHTGEPFATVMWEEPGHVVGMDGSGWFAARIDAVTGDTIKGHVVAWFNDPSKSMIVGAFTAKRCKITP
jgi:hypothetical protein